MRKLCLLSMFSILLQFSDANAQSVGINDDGLPQVTVTVNVQVASGATPFDAMAVTVVVP